jgi:hypothetical protein
MNLQEEYNLLSNKMMMKQTRNSILNQTDKYMLSDFPITPEQLELVKQYRQELRDFTNNDWIMPEKPSFVITNNN